MLYESRRDPLAMMRNPNVITDLCRKTERRPTPDGTHLNCTSLLLLRLLLPQILDVHQEDVPRTKSFCLRLAPAAYLPWTASTGLTGCKYPGSQEDHQAVPIESSFEFSAMTRYAGSRSMHAQTAGTRGATRLKNSTDWISLIRQPLSAVKRACNSSAVIWRGTLGTGNSIANSCK
jgi:hypothetical protein